jgi:DNA (cytosine-5)-methyltransferase 1
MRTVDLFAGCGGMSRGFEDAGVEVVAAFENWEPAIHAYRENFDHPVYKMDLADVDGISELLLREFAPDMVIGGPPCQDFSSAGKRLEDTRADLTVAFARTIAKVRPAYFVMENVQRARTSAAYSEARKVFKSAGYGLIETVLDAAFFGAPQRRKRFFVIGKLDAADDFSESRIENRASAEPMTVREYCGDAFRKDHYYRHPRNYTRRAVFSIDEPAPTMRGVNRPIPKGYPGHAGDSHPVSGDVEALTTEQRALIQTFPGEFRWPGARSHVEQLIGNAVPVKLAQAVADFVLTDARHELDRKLEQFEYWLAQSAKYSDHRSVSDVVSRVRRSDRLVSLIAGRPETYFENLDRNEEFRALSPDVRAQVRRAVGLFIEFSSGHSGDAAA